MATLQRMKHMDALEDELIHIVDEIHQGGEFTLCGLAIPDSYLDSEGYEHIGEEFKGSIKKCTCPDCYKIVSYIKSLR